MFANLVYAIAIALGSPVIAYKMIRYGRYRRGVMQKLFGLSRRQAESLLVASGKHVLSSKSVRVSDVATSTGRCVWVHAVSVGEVNLLPTLVRRLERQVHDARIVISVSTDSGYDLARKLFSKERVFFCPLDFTWAIRRTIRNLGPELIVLTELELWPNLIRIAHKHVCPVAVINGRLSERSAARYQKYGKLLRGTFSRLSWVGCQDATYRDRFIACGVAPDRAEVTGSIKFDNANLTRDCPDVQTLAEWAGVDPWHRVWVVGSTQSGEEEMALSVYRQLSAKHPELRLVVVPRHAERFDNVADEITVQGYKVHRRSRDKSLHQSQWPSDTVVLVDTIGELKYWWGVGQIATVGGSFGSRGGQNMLEPAGYGAAVSFGPNTKNFAEIAERLLAAGGAVRVKNEAELADFVDRCVSDPPLADGLGRAARGVVKQHRGATDRTVANLATWLPAPNYRDEVAA